MKRVLAVIALLCIPLYAQAVVLYNNSTQTGFRYSASAAGATIPADNNRVPFDDIPIPAARLGGNGFVDVTKVTVGIRQIGGAPATDVSVYWATCTTGPTAPDTELDSPGTLIGTASLPAAAASVTTPVVFGNGVATMFNVRLNSTLFTGFGTFLVGMKLSSTDPLCGWRLCTGNGAAPPNDVNANVFWQYDPGHTGQANDEGAFLFSTATPPNPLAAFYIIIEGTPVAAATGACCNSGTGVCTITQQANCLAPSNYLGDSTVCPPPPCALTGACCDNANFDCQVRTAAACAAANGNYLGNATNCNPNNCPRGACCNNTTGACSVTGPAGCAAGSTYMGNGSNCSPSPCPPSGRCCQGSNCSVVTQQACGAGTWTQGLDCVGARHAYSSSPGTAIPDNNPAGITDTINVPDTYNLTDVNVRVNIPDHTFINDLIIRLTHGATTVTLWNRQCGAEDGMDITFDDAGVAVVCAMPTTGTYRPNMPLSAFNGAAVNGAWTLAVIDVAAIDVGTLMLWSLDIADTLSCAPATGACCVGTGCSQRTQAQCDAVSGDFGGLGSNCGPCSITASENACGTADSNGDGTPNNFDIDAFVLLLTNQAAYNATFPNVSWSNSDMNCDGLINNFDIDQFVAVLTQTASKRCVPFLVQDGAATCPAVPLPAKCTHVCLTNPDCLIAGFWTLTWLGPGGVPCSATIRHAVNLVSVCDP